MWGFSTTLVMSARDAHRRHCPFREHAHLSLAHTPLRDQCVSLGGPGQVRETATDQIYNPICSVCHGVTTGKYLCVPHGMPLFIGYMLTPRAPTSKQHHTNRGSNLSFTFCQGLYWLGYGWSSALLNCLIL